MLSAVDDLFASLHRIQSRLKTIEDQKALVPVQQLLQNPRFQNALYVHNKVGIGKKFCGK